MNDEPENLPTLERVLVIDDSSGDALLAEMVVTEFIPTATVRHVDRGSTGLELLGTEAFDLVLLDLAMPGLTGFDVLDALDADPDFRTEVVVLTSSTRPEDRDRVESRGVTYVVKDSDFSAFRRDLGEVLGVTV